MPCCFGLVLPANAISIPSSVQTPSISLEGGHCQGRVWPPTPGLSILECLVKAPILPLGKPFGLARKNEVLEQGSELTRRQESARALRTIIYCNAFSQMICYSRRSRHQCRTDGRFRHRSHNTRLLHRIATSTKSPLHERPGRHWPEALCDPSRFTAPGPGRTAACRPAVSSLNWLSEPQMPALRGRRPGLRSRLRDT